jgi:hypothetical protein
MARGADRPPAPAGSRPMRPILLAGGLSLLWFAEVQHGFGGEEAPGWVLAIALAARLFADFVGAWIVVSLLRLAVVFARLRLGPTVANTGQERS